MKAEGDRLRCLQMGEARHQRVDMFLGPAQQGQLQFGQRAINRINQLAHPQLEVGGYLVIARTCRMKPPRRLANQFGKP